MIQHGEPGKTPTPPSTTGLLIQLDRLHSLSPDLIWSTLHILPQCKNIFVLSVSFLSTVSQSGVSASLCAVYLETLPKERLITIFFFFFLAVLTFEPH